VTSVAGRPSRSAAIAQRHATPAVYDDLAALLRSPQVDAVIVVTPDATHEPQVIAAAHAGKHMLCEKPMTTTVAAAILILAFPWLRGC